MLSENDWSGWVEKGELFSQDPQSWLGALIWREFSTVDSHCFIFFVLLQSSLHFAPILFFSLLTVSHHTCLLSVSHILSHLPICDCSVSLECFAFSSSDCRLSWYNVPCIKKNKTKKSHWPETQEPGVRVIVLPLAFWLDKLLYYFSGLIFFMVKQEILDQWFFLKWGHFNFPFSSCLETLLSVIAVCVTAVVIRNICCCISTMHRTGCYDKRIIQSKMSLSELRNFALDWWFISFLI